MQYKFLVRMNGVPTVMYAKDKIFANEMNKGLSFWERILLIFWM